MKMLPEIKSRMCSSCFVVLMSYIVYKSSTKRTGKLGYRWIACPLRFQPLHDTSVAKDMVAGLDCAVSRGSNDFVADGAFISLRSTFLNRTGRPGCCCWLLSPVISRVLCRRTSYYC